MVAPSAFVSASGAAPVAIVPPVGASFDIPLEGISLIELCEGQRFFSLDKCESYLHAAQDFAKMYDWDGKLVSSPASPLQPGFTVPFSDRRPSVRYDLARVIVERFTALLFGTDRFPGASIIDDPAAEDFVKWLISESRIQQRFIQARSLGGAVGSVCASFAFVGGRPRVEVHNAKHCRVVSWADRADFRPKAMLKAYKYPRQVYDPKAKKLVTVDYFYARFWDETREILWEPITMDVAKQTDWFHRAPRSETFHSFGFCPAYWIQNRPCDEDEDGYSDFHGLFDNFDEVNRLLSSAARAVKANADPTLVVKTSPAHNEGHIRKGAGAAIFAEGGANYMTIPADAVDAIFKTVHEIVSGTLDVASVVMVDPSDMKGQLSSLTLKMLFAPMLAQADVYREQYGEMGLKRILIDMLRASRKLGARPPVRVTDDAGNVLHEEHAGIIAPPRFDMGEGGAISKTDRAPGVSEMLTLNWNPYFSPTWSDIKDAVQAAKAANGDKPVISQRTSIAATQTLFGVNDVEGELRAIEDDVERSLRAAQRAMVMTGGLPPDPAALDREEADEEAEEGDETDDETEAPPKPPPARGRALAPRDNGEESESESD